MPVKGRLKELWKPIIQIVSGLTVEKDLRAQLEHLQKERLSEKTNTLDGHIVKVVCELYTSDEPLFFSDVWDALVKDLDGKLDDKKPNKVDTPEFGEVTKQKIGYRLREVLGGKKAKSVGHTNDRVYVFDSEKLMRIAKKYGCSVADKQTTRTSSSSVLCVALLSLAEMDLGIPNLQKFNATFAVIAATGIHDKAGMGVASPTVGDVSLKTPFFPYGVTLLILGK